MGHHQYWKASPVDTTPLAFGEHKEFVSEAWTMGWPHAVSREESAGVSQAPSCKRLLKPIYSPCQQKQLNSVEDPVTQGRVAGIV
jgi:hypothetical protein